MRCCFLFFGLTTSAFLCAQPIWNVGGTSLSEHTLVSGVNIPWELTWGPDNMLWCTTREGDVLRIDPTSGAYDTVLELNVYDSGTEPGLLGMVLHPDWESTPSVFLVYTAYDFQNGNHERLSVFEWNGTELENEQILHTVDAASIHNGSRLLILPDNTLLMSTGDTGDGGVSSMDPNRDNGKILRLNLDGSIPTDNPNPFSHVFSSGHRNSQGLCLGPNGLVYSSEHGQYNFDEFNIIQAGGNYGWPHVEGGCDGVCDWCNASEETSFCDANDVIEPLMTWSPCAAVSDIIYYDHPSIPEWQGCVLMATLGGFADPIGGRLNVLHMSEDGLTVLSDEFAFSEFNQRVRDVAVNPITGALYLALNGPSYGGNGPNVIKEFRPATLGCTDDQAPNYNVWATVDDGSCIDLVLNCSAIEGTLWDDFAIGIYPSTFSGEVGQSMQGEFVYHVPATYVDSTTGNTFVIQGIDEITFTPWPESIQLISGENAIAGAEQGCFEFGGVPLQEGAFEIIASANLSLEVFGETYVYGNIQQTVLIEVTADASPYVGCTYELADNYLPFATEDDGTCAFLGCMDQNALNFNRFANVDNGSCEFEVVIDLCPSDLNGDGIVGSSDLLELLSNFGVHCPFE